MLGTNAVAPHTKTLSDVVVVVMMLVPLVSKCIVTGETAM
jgi:hypothetical protein